MGPLWDCMQQNADYYAPQVEALQSGRGPSSASGAGSSHENPTAVGDSKDSGASRKEGSADSAPTSPDTGSSVSDGSVVFDIEKATDKDIEAYLEQIDKDESRASGRT